MAANVVVVVKVKTAPANPTCFFYYAAFQLVAIVSETLSSALYYYCNLPLF